MARLAWRRSSDVVFKRRVRVEKYWGGLVKFSDESGKLRACESGQPVIDKE